MVSLRPSYKAWLDEYYCVSTDEKPVGVNIKNGSSLKEMDTGKKYMFDAEHQEWLEVSGNLVNGGGSSNSSSGNTGSAGVMVVEVEADATFTDNTLVCTVTNCSATFEEVHSALDSGTLVTFRVTAHSDGFDDIYLFLPVCYAVSDQIMAHSSTISPYSENTVLMESTDIVWYPTDQYPLIRTANIPMQTGMK